MTPNELIGHKTASKRLKVLPVFSKAKSVKLPRPFDKMRSPRLYASGDYHPSHKGAHIKMELKTDLKAAICALFEVHEDEGGTQRVVTPLAFAGSRDQVVVRVRPRGTHWEIDENAEASLYARMNGGDVDGDNLRLWANELERNTGVALDDDEKLLASVQDQRLIAPAILNVASAAQQLYALATAHKEREASDFKNQVAAIVTEVCHSLGVAVSHNARLPISGDLEADHVIGDAARPIIVVTATSAKRLLEAEVIHMQYQLSKQPGFVLAVAESQKTVGVKQFNRANYYTGKTVQFSPFDFAQLLRGQLH